MNSFKGLKEVRADQVKQDRVYSWIYQAERAGTTGKGISKGDGFYDARPLCVILQIDRKGILGLNTHYLENIISRGKLILKLRTKMDISSAMISRMIHRYKLENIKSSIYEVNDVTVDAQVLATFAKWIKIDS